jgi:signal transduction histidine kinase
VRTFLELLDLLNLGIFTLVALVALWQWRSGRSRTTLWAAAAFVALALVGDAARVLPEDDEGTWDFVARRTLIAVLVLFPYLLYRFTTAFQPPTRGLERLLGVMTVAVLVFTYVVPDFPEEGEPRTGAFIAYLVAFLVHWTALTVVVAARLWRAGRGQPSVARRRMHLLAFASVAITVAIFLAAFRSDDDAGGLALAVTLTTSLSALAFLFGLRPPWVLRAWWRRPELERVQSAIAGLMSATTEREIAERVLEPMAALVGARAVALLDERGAAVGSHGASAEMLAAASTGTREPDRGELLHLDVPSGSVLVWTTPYAPFFGQDEMATLRTLGALTGLALDRARLFGRERDARVALERADEVKTNFVALAAHELRTPVATIDGIVSTLVARRDVLPREQRALLEGTLHQQSGHMRQLVDQLLDLSRLDAEAVAIEPRPLAVREHVESVVTAIGTDDEMVEIEIEPELQTVADATAFDRIVANLVVNAVRHGEPPIVVRAEQRDRHFRLAVEDRGPGVPPEFVPDLFERFTRSRAAGERVAGTGLGLAIARSYAKAHGGDLLYETAQPHGARFQLVLPVEPAPHGAPLAG